jgi:hydroxyethylthiazole kinase-like uncharacterized protein yjeF
MSGPTPLPLDSNWLREHPLPAPDAHADKNARGRVFIVGGCATVPGGLLLTAEAALRAGAGKVQVATVASIALALGIAMPEIAVFPIAEGGDGEMTDLHERLDDPIARCDALVIGPAMGCGEAAGRVLDRMLRRDARLPLILDAAALMDLPSRAGALRHSPTPAILTPHVGEMAAMLDCPAEAIEADRAQAVRRAAEHFGAVVALKGSTSLVAAPDGQSFAYAGGGVGLATGGSGDVLAGIAAGLVARGAPPLEAALWAIWLHGEAGRRCAVEIGPIGFLARELLGQVPGLMKAI